MEAENLGIKQIEKILSNEIMDWLRWGKSKDYLPSSFRCPLGQMYIPKRGDLEANLYKPMPVNELQALAFEKIVIGLPTKHRQAFVLHHLGRVHKRGRIIEKKLNGYDIAKLLGMHRSRYYVILAQAYNMIFHRWKLSKHCNKNTDPM